MRLSNPKQLEVIGRILIMAFVLSLMFCMLIAGIEKFIKLMAITAALLIPFGLFFYFFLRTAFVARKTEIIPARWGILLVLTLGFSVFSMFLTGFLVDRPTTPIWDGVGFSVLAGGGAILVALLGGAVYWLARYFYSAK